MSTRDSSSRRLTVNAAFLKDIKDDNRQLKDLLAKIDALVRPRQLAGNHWADLVKLFGELRDQLAFHFSLEEAYGYFDSALDAEPRLSAYAEVLRNQHTGLFASVRDLADRALETPMDRETQVDQLLANYAEFIKQFSKHEDDELRLILKACDDDLGVGD